VSKVYRVVFRLMGSAVADVKAKSKEDAKAHIRGGCWDDIDIDVEDIIDIEDVKAYPTLRKKEMTQ